jgi:hypothetical protein
MVMAAGAVAAGGAAVAARMQAIKASGVLVSVAPAEFLSIIQKQQGPLIVHAKGGIFRTNYQYLTSYKGLAFFTKSPELLTLPAGSEIVNAGGIFIPG